MAEAFKLTRVPTLKTVADFRAHVASLGLDLPCEDQIVAGSSSPLAQPIDGVTINGKRIGNRWAIHPMEGWDGTTTGQTHTIANNASLTINSPNFDTDGDMEERLVAEGEIAGDYLEELLDRLDFDGDIDQIFGRIYAAIFWRT